MKVTVTPSNVVNLKVGDVSLGEFKKVGEWEAFEKYSNDKGGVVFLKKAITLTQFFGGKDEADIVLASSDVMARIYDLELVGKKLKLYRDSEAAEPDFETFINKVENGTVYFPVHKDEYSVPARRVQAETVLSIKGRWGNLINDDD